jgi:hypothetical protein
MKKEEENWFADSPELEVKCDCQQCRAARKKPVQREKEKDCELQIKDLYLEGKNA